MNRILPNFKILVPFILLILYLILIFVNKERILIALENVNDVALTYQQEKEASTGKLETGMQDIRVNMKIVRNKKGFRFPEPIAIQVFLYKVRPISGAKVSASATSPAGKILNIPFSENVLLGPTLPESGSYVGIVTDLDEDGQYQVIIQANDNNGNSVRQTQLVVVEDTIPPVIERIVATPDVLRPPSHKMVPVTLNVTASDNCDTVPFCQIISVSSNEPEDGLGDGDMSPDWEITGNLTANLRAERSGKGSGRVYTITVRCTDYAGNSSEGQTTVTVPHDKKKK